MCQKKFLECTVRHSVTLVVTVKMWCTDLKKVWTVV
jgi:hypothetical protein